MARDGWSPPASRARLHHQDAPRAACPRRRLREGGEGGEQRL